MSFPERSRTPLTDVALFALGAFAIALGPRLGQATGQPFLALGPLFLVGIGAGLVEAASARRSGRRRWLGSWLPAVLGVLAFFFGQFASERFGGPWHVDSGMAWGIYLATIVVVVPAFGLLVNVVAALALRSESRRA